MIDGGLAAAKKMVNEQSGGKAGGGGGSKSSSEPGGGKDVIELTEANWRKKVLNNEKGILVEFFAPWCGHCKRLAPTWDELAGKFAAAADVTVAKVDCTSDDNKNKELCSAQGVNGFPTLHLYKEGKKVNRNC